MSDSLDLLTHLDDLEGLRSVNSNHNRHFKRFVIRGEAELHPLGSDELDRTPIDIKLRDIGCGGLGFVTSLPLEAGSLWRVNFLQRSYTIGQQPLVVRHCKKVQENIYLIGGQFCVEPGLMMLLGIDVADLQEQSTLAADDFAAPSDLT